MLDDQRHLFDIPEDITYLNIASQSPSFNAVYEAGIEGLKQKNRPYNIATSDYFEPVIELKKRFAKLIDTDDHNRIANIPSVSYGMANAANNIKLKPGDEILLMHEQFPSNYYIWKRLADKNDATLVTIMPPVAKEHRGRLWNQVILNAINERTAVVAMGNIHWSNGTLFDLKTIATKAKQYNAVFIIDGSQSVGALPFSVKELQPDALICAGYKWLFGPYGCGYAYYGPYFDNGIPIEENWTNRLHSENFSGLTHYQPEYKPLANRYSVGESGSFIYVKMQNEALKQVLEWTPLAVQDYCRMISEDAVAELQKMGCQIEDPKYRTHHLFGIELPENLDVLDLKAALQRDGIYVSFRGRYIRISCHLFNTKNDFQKLVACLKSIL